MGKITGFMELERIDIHYDAPDNRLKHYKEFTIQLSDVQVKNQAARCMDCGIPFCNNGCPVNNIIPDWNDLVYNNAWEQALTVLHSTNNFPEFTGRICPAPCEAACTLNIDDAPVGIKSIEQAIIDKGWDNGWVKPQIAASNDDLPEPLPPISVCIAPPGTWMLRFSTRAAEIVRSART